MQAKFSETRQLISSVLDNDTLSGAKDACDLD
jgi:hypothetical protein